VHLVKEKIVILIEAKYRKNWSQNWCKYVLALQGFTGVNSKSCNFIMFCNFFLQFINETPRHTMS